MLIYSSNPHQPPERFTARKYETSGSLPTHSQALFRGGGGALERAEVRSWGRLIQHVREGAGGRRDEAEER